jgi:excisionase family DNA binding protein
MTTPSKRSPVPRYAKLDGKPLAKPRGRHAVAHSTTAKSENDDAERKVITIPMTQRLGYRPGEFAALLGVSVPTIWRQIRDKKIEVVEIGNVKLIPRAFAIKHGLITSDDTI